MNTTRCESSQEGWRLDSAQIGSELTKKRLLPARSGDKERLSVAAALSLLSFGIVWAAMLALLFVGRGRTRPVQVAATR